MAYRRAFPLFSRQPKQSGRRGITLIMVAGVLAILAALSTSFYTLMLSQTKSAARYSDSVRAELMARAGIEDAVGRLRQQAFEKTEDSSDPWFTVDFLNGARKKISFSDRAHNMMDDDGDGKVDNAEESSMSYSGVLGNTAGRQSDRFVLSITDAASRININAGDNLAVILDNLCRVVGPPLVAAELDAIQPRRWSVEVNGGDPVQALFQNDKNTDDTDANRDVYYTLFDDKGAKSTDGTGRPQTRSDGTALYGDGYAIAGYRARHGRFHRIEDVKNALSFVKQNTGNKETDRQLEEMERDVKFQALRDFITIDSWTDTNTVCVGKFEWTANDTSNTGIAIDRDKSWIPSVNDKGVAYDDPQNTRGSLQGCYVSIINGHGAGQLRKIIENGVDWIRIENGWTETTSGTLTPGPISSYMIVAREDANPDPYDPNNGLQPDELDFEPAGKLKDHPDIDYRRFPLCIHRAPVNVNTASDKVLAALLLGINVQHGHPMAIGTDSDLNKISPNPAIPGLMNSLRTSAYSATAPAVLNAGVAADYWKVPDGVLQLESYLLTPKGLKRVPGSAGKPALDRPVPWATGENEKFAYFTNNGQLSLAGDFVPGVDGNGNAVSGAISEAHELAYRIIRARERKLDAATGKPTKFSDPDPITADADTGFNGYERGPLKSWDDFYFRVVKPWDDQRFLAGLPDSTLPGRSTIPNSGKPGVTEGRGKTSVARMIMAHFNSNTNILKFNPGIEWIDRWGRNFTEMEPVMIFKGTGPDWTAQQWAQSRPAGAPKGSYFIRSLRYKSDEMIDKTDMNRSTTELCFDSGGVYEIISTGQVMKRGELLAERRVEALVKVYDVWRESTQRQFVRGTISKAARGNVNKIKTAEAGYTDSGRVARDSRNQTESLALDTLPEPLVPLKYRIKAKGGALEDNVATGAFDALGRPKDYEVPDVVQNRVMPAAYDGQIVLATNTGEFQRDAADKDSFLASFDGDLDTGTAIGNGREQSKTPANSKMRVVDTIGLLGILNDTEVDLDPDDYPVFVVSAAQNVSMAGMKSIDTDPITGATRSAYWSNLSVRMGDLRAEGVFLGAMGTALKDGTLKYLYDGVEAIDSKSGYKGPPATPGKNYDPGHADGCTISVWFKPNWHAQDNREHEFFNGSSLGNTSDARYNALYKSGRYSFSKPTGVAGGNGSSDVWERNNCLWFGTEDGSRAGGSPNDDDLMNFLHGGTNQVKVANLPPTDGSAPRPNVVTPAYTAQPFRWANTGARWKYKVATKVGGVAPYTGTTQFGYWHGRGATDPFSVDLVTNVARPSISTQRDPEGEWKPDYYWIHTQVAMKDDKSGAYNGMMQGCDLRGQPASYRTLGNKTVDHPNPKFMQGCFTVNNVNESQTSWIYRSTPTDGTYAVIDELRISKKEWESDRIAAEQTRSRYYLPKNPESRADCPTFMSQTLLSSQRGIDSMSDGDSVTLVRVNWTAFTPRFMHEYKMPGKYQRREVVGEANAVRTITSPFKGPFDYSQYNYDVGYDAFNGWKHPSNNALKPELGVERMPPEVGKPSHYTQGIEVEVMDDDKPINGFTRLETEAAKPATTFTNPDAINSFSDAGGNNAKRVTAGRLRYLVRFRYPVHEKVDPQALGVCKSDETGRLTVNPDEQYMLDTPVFDDISITYMMRPRVLAYRVALE